jgi:predicted O-methyltransferase YrrM
MVKKLYQSKIFSHAQMFKINDNQFMTTHEAMFLLYKTLTYFQPKSVLEIGFGAGQSAGIILESTLPGTKIISVDKSNQYHDQFNKIFPNNGIEFMHLDSRNLSLNHNFDFVFIDGDHEYEGVYNDLTKCLPTLHRGSILCMDDYLHFNGVSKVIKDYLLGQNDFVPFLCGEQNMFFHHYTHDANKFLDSDIMKDTDDFIEFSTIDYHGFNVTKGRMFSKAFTQDTNLFRQILKFYDH